MTRVTCTLLAWPCGPGGHSMRLARPRARCAPLDVGHGTLGLAARARATHAAPRTGPCTGRPMRLRGWTATGAQAGRHAHIRQNRPASTALATNDPRGAMWLLSGPVSSIDAPVTTWHASSSTRHPRPASVEKHRRPPCGTHAMRTWIRSHTRAADCAPRRAQAMPWMLRCRTCVQ